MVYHCMASGGYPEGKIYWEQDNQRTVNHTTSSHVDTSSLLYTLRSTLEVFHTTSVACVVEKPGQIITANCIQDSGKCHSSRLDEGSVVCSMHGDVLCSMQEDVLWGNVLCSMQGDVLWGDVLCCMQGYKFATTMNCCIRTIPPLTQHNKCTFWYSSVSSMTPILSNYEVMLIRMSKTQHSIILLKKVFR